MLGETVGIFFGARTPENVVSDSPELSQIDLYVRLNAMADEDSFAYFEIYCRKRRS